MSKDKISSQEIIDFVASKAAVSKRASEEFLKTMISSIEDALLAGEIVKIKGFGTFKLQWNEPRKSVNVQTGESIILDGYHKVVFVPENSLKELVNEPFAHLQAVELDVETENVVSEKKTQDVLDPLRTFTEQASEIKDILSEIKALSNTTRDSVSDISEILEPTFEIAEEEAVAEVEMLDVVEEEIENQPIVVEKAPEIVVPILTDKLFEPQPEVAVTSPIIENSKLLKRKNKVWALMTILLVIGTLIGTYFIVPPAKDFADKTYQKAKTKALKMSEKVSITDMTNTISGWFNPKPKSIPVIETIIISKDTTELDTVGQKLEVDSLQLLFDNPRVFDGYLGNERIKEGSRLTLMAKRYYGNKDFWVYIYEANKDKIQNPSIIAIGTLIKIPKVDIRLLDASNPRCIAKAKELHDIYTKK